jgi:hypothetical protein
MGPYVLLAVLAMWPELSALAQKQSLHKLPPEIQPPVLQYGQRDVNVGNPGGTYDICQMFPNETHVTFDSSPLGRGWTGFDQNLWSALAETGERTTYEPFSRSISETAVVGSSRSGTSRPTLPATYPGINTLFAMGFRGERAKQSLGWQRDLEVASLNSKVILIDSDPDASMPVRRNGWQREDTVKMPLSHRFFLVGQFGANSDDADRQAYSVVGRTGIGWKLPPWLGGEIQIRGGKSMTNYDSTTADIIPDKARTFYEINTKWPVWRLFNLEYTQETRFASTPDEHDRLKQDLRVALPLSDTGQFHIGAKYYRYLDGTTTTPWLERLQFYLGLQYKR